MTELYMVNENGQLEINFESLELLVDKSTFYKIENYISVHGYDLQSISEGDETDFFNMYLVHPKHNTFVLVQIMNGIGNFVLLTNQYIEEIAKIGGGLK